VILLWSWELMEETGVSLHETKLSNKYETKYRSWQQSANDEWPSEQDRQGML
jgi:hypothetical protein